MSQRNTLLIVVAAIAALGGGCRKAPTSPATLANAQATPAVTQSGDKAIETEIVSAAPIAGAVSATGKISVPEDRTAIIGPVNEGRIVKLYAGQGSRVRKGQTLAELESADIDQAEADYIKALADAENARRSAAAEIRLAQQTYDRTKTL
ncbi:MAG TPA: efflux RND transporter periplasmic adaptor subunit, partial [Pyrinomonadaceae bacterium]|nr:efflux RND transporter periplasmic adaptor subunit [Pyrinomonadaceae bacterium]